MGYWFRNKHCGFGLQLFISRYGLSQTFAPFFLEYETAHTMRSTTPFDVPITKRKKLTLLIPKRIHESWKM